MKTTPPSLTGIIPIVLMLLLMPGLMLSGEQTNTRGLGMARTSVASSRTLDAVGINPANLALIP